MTLGGKDLRVWVDAVGPRTGGSITVLRSLAVHFSRLRPNWQFRVFVLPGAAEVLSGLHLGTNIGTSVVPDALSPFARVRWQQWTLPRLAVAEKADVVFSVSNIGARTPKVPTVIYYHQARFFFYEPTLRERLRDRMRRWWTKRFVMAGLRGTACVIVQTEALRQAMIRQTRLPPERFVCVHAGLPEPGVLCPEERKWLDSVLLRVRNLPQPTWLYVSHPGSHKNFEVLFRAAAVMKRAGISGSFALTLDETRPHDRSYSTFLAKYRCEIARRDVSDRVVLVGSVPTAGVVELLGSCSGLVFPSLMESFGQPLIEAAAAGAPLLLADRPYAWEIAQGAAVYFDPLDDGRGLADCINQLTSDNKRLEALGRASAELAFRFSWQKAAEKILSIMETVVESQSR